MKFYCVLRFKYAYILNLVDEPFFTINACKSLSF